VVEGASVEIVVEGVTVEEASELDDVGIEGGTAEVVVDDATVEAAEVSVV